MAAGRHKIRATAPSQWQLAVAAVVAASLIVAVAGDAFLAPVRPALMAEPTSAAGLFRPVGVRTALEVQGSSCTSGFSIVKVAASVTLLFVAASKTRQKSSKVRKQAATIRYGHAVAFDYASLHALPSMQKPVPLTIQPPIQETAEIAHLTVNNLIETSAVMAAPEFRSLASEAVPRVAASATVHVAEALYPRARPSAAQIAGGARRPRTHHKSRTFRTARHATGRRLVERVVSQPAVRTYDASRLRKQIQMGIRRSGALSSCGTGRELKTASGSEGADATRILNFVPSHQWIL